MNTNRHIDLCQSFLAELAKIEKINVTIFT